MATTDTKVQHLLSENAPVPPAFQEGHLQVNGVWDGSFVGKELGGARFTFLYFENTADEYRITIVADADTNFYKFEVNATDGGHETLVQMTQITDMSVIRAP